MTERTKRLVDVGLPFVLFLLILLASLARIAQAQQEKMVYRPSQGYMPSTLVIKATESDSARVCAEPPDGGLVACKTVGELRKWITDKAAK